MRMAHSSVVLGGAPGNAAAVHWLSPAIVWTSCTGRCGGRGRAQRGRLLLRALHHEDVLRRARTLCLVAEPDEAKVKCT